jgi:hypothetical protein
MPLQTPYGVVSGVVDHADLLNPSGGQWPHYHIWINTPGGQYDSAVNLKSLTEVKIEYRTRDLQADEVASILSLPDGWTPLAQTPASGALDYVRHPALIGSTGWILQNGDNLINLLKYLLTGVQRIHVFGAAYSTGLGVHDVHMNQGDPINSPFALLDAIWQDGGLLFQYGAPQYRLTVLQIKFETQSLHTDDQGRPIPILRLPPRYAYVPWWKWPPENPMSEIERRTLLRQGLFEILQWSGAIHYVQGEAREVLQRELDRQLATHLPNATREQLQRVADYVVKMGVELR